MAHKVRIDMTGRRYGRLVGVAFSHKGPCGHAHWLFACDCGGEVVASGGNVRTGGTRSCGCLHREVSAARLTTHGRRARKRHDPTYRAWQGMNDACGNPVSGGYARRGARRVRVTPHWRADFEAFLADMGERPDGAILVRHDDAGDFTPANCAWVAGDTRSERARTGWRRRARATQPERMLPTAQ